MKLRCSKCQKKKRATQFYRRLNGYQSRCKLCDNTARSTASGDGVYDQIARELKITPTRVRQIEQSALRKLAKLKLAKELR